MTNFEDKDDDELTPEEKHEKYNWDEKMENIIPFEETLPDPDCDHPEGEIVWDRTAPVGGGLEYCKKCEGYL